jgi:CheY-like chemotaxis protein
VNRDLTEYGTAGTFSYPFTSGFSRQPLNGVKQPMSDPQIVPARAVLSVLVVDDSSEVRSLMRRILEGAGYLVCEAADGTQALSILSESTSVSAVVADIRMPNMDGWQLAAQLAKRSPRVPILFMSGYDVHLASATLPGPLLPKPFRAETLLERLNQLLKPEQKRASGELSRN